MVPGLPSQPHNTEELKSPGWLWSLTGQSLTERAAMRAAVAYCVPGKGAWAGWTPDLCEAVLGSHLNCSIPRLCDFRYTTQLLWALLLYL